MKIGIITPAPPGDVFGGAERLAAGLVDAIRSATPHDAEIVSPQVDERTFRSLVASYEMFASLDVSAFDLVITGKYPAWMVQHPRHHLYLLHPLRGLYDTYHLCRPPFAAPEPDREVRAVQAALRLTRCRDDLPRLFDALRELFATHADDDRALAFPGPLARDVVHALDRVATAPDQVRRYSAISHTVARRPDYLPTAVEVHVAHPPSTFSPARSDLTPRDADRFVTVSRLDAPKRLDLLIAAMRHTAPSVRLLIAGRGPDEAALKSLAAHDSRIEFAGFVEDNALGDLYASSIAVPFVPLDEDFGLIAHEAALAGRAVVTTVDSGGARELVANGRNGIVVAPTPAAIGAALTRLQSDRALATRLGTEARTMARSVTWEAVLAGVLGSDSGVQAPVGTPSDSKPDAPIPPRRTLAPRVVVVTTFPVHPRAGGGQLRSFHLYGNLAPKYDVEIVSVDAPGAGSGGWHSFREGFREVVVPKSLEHVKEEARAAAAAGIPVDDIVMSDLLPLTPEYDRVLRASLDGAAAVVLSHPFLTPAVRRVAPNIPLVYDAHNAEVVLKASVLPHRDGRDELLARVEDIEAMACREAAFVSYCSRSDGEVLTARFSVAAESMVFVPNGVDTSVTRFCGGDERRSRERRWLEVFLRRDRSTPEHMGLFVASWHPPNIEAAQQIIEVAPFLPEIEFVLVGSHCSAFHGLPLPSNVTLAGVVSEATLAVLLASAGVALNPMLGGGGSNLKMLEYFAAGAPVVSTPVGSRGITSDGAERFLVADIDDFPDAIASVFEAPEAADTRAVAARAMVEREHDWRVLSGVFSDRLASVAAPRPFALPTP